MRQTLIIFIKTLSTIILIYNIPALLMGYAFTGKGVYVIMILIFLYSIYSIYSSKNIFVVNIFVYSAGFLYIFREYRRHLLEYGFIFDDQTVSDLITLLSFLILFTLSLVAKIQNSNK